MQSTSWWGSETMQHKLVNLDLTCTVETQKLPKSHRKKTKLEDSTSSCFQLLQSFKGQSQNCTENGLQNLQLLLCFEGVNIYHDFPSSEPVLKYSTVSLKMEHVGWNPLGHHFVCIRCHLVQWCVEYADMMPANRAFECKLAWSLNSNDVLENSPKSPLTILQNLSCPEMLVKTK